MKISFIKYLTYVSAAVLLFYACDSNLQKQAETNSTAYEIPKVNIDHLMYLYDVIDLPGNVNGGIVHIYSEYPNYEYEIESKEGYTCVDDVARAMMVDAVRFADTGDVKLHYDFMAEFLLYMQAENGYFYNFIWNDLSINKTYRTSLAEPNWWSWRAFWALANYKSENKEMMAKSRLACERLADNIFTTYLDLPETFDTIKGVVIPNWMPLQNAGDQAAVIIMGLESYYTNINKDERALKLIEKFARGLMLSQKGGNGEFPFGAYLSWQNIWHAYGNSQAYAMLRAGQLLNREDFIKSALLEIDNLYPYLKSEKYLAHFAIQKKEGKYSALAMGHFAQIAYNFRPMVWACIEAYKVTEENKYLDEAKAIASWFAGNNWAKIPMYSDVNGRCFDGIVAPSDINFNSGAESTIEALLALQAFESLKNEKQ